MNRPIIFFIVLLTLILLFAGCKTLKVEKENQQPGHKIEYALEINDNRHMSFKIKNHTMEDIELVTPTTRTFNFFLYKDGNVVWDSHKDDKTMTEQNWESHGMLKANGEGEIPIWYANISKDLNGIYDYEFYSTCDKLKDVPHLTGTLEFISGKFALDRVKVVK